MIRFLILKYCKGFESDATDWHALYPPLQTPFGRKSFPKSVSLNYIAASEMLKFHSLTKFVYYIPLEEISNSYK